MQERSNELKGVSDDHLVAMAGMPGGAEQAHAELIRRNTKAMREYSKSSQKYADLMAVLTVVLLLVAVLQLITSIYQLSGLSENMKVAGSILVLVIIGSMYYLFIKDVS